MKTSLSHLSVVMNLCSMIVFSLVTTGGVAQMVERSLSM